MDKYKEFQEKFKELNDTERLRQAVRILNKPEHLGKVIEDAFDLLTDWFKERGYIYDYNYSNLEFLHKESDYGRATGICIAADASKGDKVTVGRFIAAMTLELKLKEQARKSLEDQCRFDKITFIEERGKLESFLTEIYKMPTTPKDIKDLIEEKFYYILPDEESDS